jgi:dephospho-CoA kinase
MIKKINPFDKGNKRYCIHIFKLIEEREMAFKHAVVLTGGIATGKSTVANYFLAEGFKIIDADKIAHLMLDLHHDKIAELFGSKYVTNGEVNRKALGSLIFSDKKEKRRLEQLLHPLIFKEIEQQSIALDRLKKPYLIDIPLFFESKGRYPIKESIVVYTPPTIQLKRLMERDKSTNIEAQQRIDSQITIEKKRDLSTYLIDNSKDLKYLQEECARVKNIILSNSFQE